MKQAFLIAAASSGSGKTTLTLGILRALAEQGLRVQPFKCGPDYIDPQYHAIACGVESVNLDPWMNGEDGVKAAFARYSKDCDVAVVEGVMGLFDGADGMRGSSAEVAELLHLPVILVIDARSMAFSAAPLLYGYKHFRPEVNIAGVIFNKVGSDRHYSLLRQAAEAAGVPCLGYVPRNKSLYAPSRHLGLDLSEKGRIKELAGQVAQSLRQYVPVFGDFARSSCIFASTAFQGGSAGSSLLGTPAAPTLPSQQEQEQPFASTDAKGSVYVAHDEAFNFIYRESLDKLSQIGTLHFFSPLADEPVGPEATLVYLPGGYPEFFLPQLAASQRTMESLRNTKARIIAECGGMMYLGQSIDDYPMAGLLPVSTTMQEAHLHLGYKTYDCHGHTLRGHEFHYSDYSDPVPQDHFLPFTKDGKDIFASYIHWSPESLLKLAEV